MVVLGQGPSFQGSDLHQVRPERSWDLPSGVGEQRAHILAPRPPPTTTTTETADVPSSCQALHCDAPRPTYILGGEFVLCTYEMSSRESDR